jgi:hypothetical protein
VGTKYTLAVDTTQYSGNFEREMAFFMTGQQVEYMPGGLDWLEKAVEADPAPDLDILDYRHGEHGDTFVTIVETPGTVPDGFRNGKKVKMAQSYQSVGLFLNRKPKTSELEALKERALKFVKLGKMMEGASKYRVEITGFRLLTLKSDESGEAV